MILYPLKTKADLKDVTFVIPFYPDSRDRIENVKCILSYLRANFECRILLVENNRTPSFDVMYHINGVNYQLINSPTALEAGFIFHRTRIINEGIKRVSTPYFAIYDTDCIFEPSQIASAVHTLRNGIQVVYPYAGHFIDISRSYIKDGYIVESTTYATESVGGAVFLNTEDYIKGGLENQNILGWGFDDCERWHRLKILEYSIARIDGKCWHINHERGINSSNQNPYDAKNAQEFEKVKAMGKEELQQYISTWQWATAQ